MLLSLSFSLILRYLLQLLLTFKNNKTYDLSKSFYIKIHKSLCTSFHHIISCKIINKMKRILYTTPFLHGLKNFKVLIQLYSLLEKYQGALYFSFHAQTEIQNPNVSLVLYQVVHVYNNALLIVFEDTMNLSEVRITNSKVTIVSGLHYPFKYLENGIRASSN